MPFLSPTSAKDIHWTSSILQPLIDLQGRDIHTLLGLLGDVKGSKYLKLHIIEFVSGSDIIAECNSKLSNVTY